MKHSLPLRAASLAARVLMRADGAVRPIRTTTTLDAVRMRSDVRDYVQRRAHYFGVFEHGLTELVRHTVQPGDTVLDVGANVGYVSLLAARRAGTTGRVVAVEADPDVHRMLQANLAMNPELRVETHQVAVTADRCRVSMRLPDPRNLGSGTAAVDDGGSVEGKPLAEAVGLNALHAASLVKVDVEGAEGPILADLAEHAPRMQQRLTIAIEVHDHTAHLLAPLTEQGFDLFVLPNDYAIEEYLRQRWRPDPARYAPQRVDGYVPGEHDYVLVRSS